MTTTATHENIESSLETKECMVYYAYADNVSKTWYVTSLKRAPYKGLVLLFELGCLITSKPIHHPDKSTPVVGTVLNSIAGERLEVIDCTWV